MTASSAQPFRLASGGRIDRARRIGFRFDGRAYVGFHGDTLASALIANGVRLVGRSFKYHRPRGILSAGPEEPNALVRLGTGAQAEPNTRATQVQLHEGLEAFSQNAWPSLAFDLRAIQGLFKALLPAGFYYKTFMWPGWMAYEGLIRRAAGMGRASTKPDTEFHDKRHAHCDVLVVGAGPAGLAAALAAAEGGGRVMVIDEGLEHGGSLLVDDDPFNGASPLEWVASACAKLAANPNVRLLPRTVVTGFYDHTFLIALEQPGDGAAGSPAPGQPKLRLWKIRAREVVLATGAIERPLVFADNDRPGIMLAGAVRTYIRRYAALPGHDAIVCTNNDSAYSCAHALADAGARVMLADARADPPAALVRHAVAAGIEVVPRTAVVGTRGGRSVKAALLAQLSDDGRQLASPVFERSCDLIAQSGGWNPALHLYAQAGGTLGWDQRMQVFVPTGKTAPGFRAVVAGAANGTQTLASVLADGARTGAEAVARAGFPVERMPSALKAIDPNLAAPVRALWSLPASSKGPRFVDLQNDVTVDDLALAVREGYAAVEHLKRYTTTGMGTDQGKTGNVNALGVLSELTGTPMGAGGVTTFRPPYSPVNLGAIAGPERGPLFAPVMVTPLHAEHAALGARFEDAGEWKRTRYYPRPGESMAGAVAREVGAVRERAGLFDASTLGKIDIRGRDAAALLDRLYTNAWGSLGVGRCRYGLMLNEKGMVFDDGVTARLAEHHFHMTTTTGGGSRVLAWIEDWLQTEWQGLRVQCTPVTDQWAVVVLTGPRARDILAPLTDIDLGPEAFPFMTVRSGKVAGVPARVFRVSFTGELSYEINVAAGYGAYLWRTLMAAGRIEGLAAFGTEAMHVLRAEKGFPMVGHETDGTVTPFDLGLGRLVKEKPDFLGKRSLARSAMAGARRKQLVGLLTDDGARPIETGASLIEARRATTVGPTIGHVCSSYMSPTLGRAIALGLVENGRARIGQSLFSLPLEGGDAIAVSVVDPVFCDHHGGRARG
jgi:sarcosine oxidase subunit alpha